MFGIGGKLENTNWRTQSSVIQESYKTDYDKHGNQETWKMLSFHHLKRKQKKIEIN